MFIHSFIIQRLSISIARNRHPLNFLLPKKTRPSSHPRIMFDVCLFWMDFECGLWLDSGDQKRCLASRIPKYGTACIYSFFFYHNTNFALSGCWMDNKGCRKTPFPQGSFPAPSSLKMLVAVKKHHRRNEDFSSSAFAFSSHTWDFLKQWFIHSSGSAIYNLGHTGVFMEVIVPSQ